MRRRLPASTALITVTLALASCALPTQDRAERIDAVPFDLTETTVSGPTTSLGPLEELTAETTQIFLVQDGRLVAVSRPAIGEPDEIIDLLADGATDDEARRGIRSAVVSNEILALTAVEDRIATIDLAPSFTEIPASEQRLAVAEITYTLTGLPEIAGVAFTLGGRPTSVPRGDGTSSDGPVDRDDYAAVAPA
jgi:hypothetical protein